MKDKTMVKGYKIIDVKPDEEFKDDYRRSGDNKSVKKWLNITTKKFVLLLKKKSKKLLLLNTNFYTIFLKYCHGN